MIEKAIGLRLATEDAPLPSSSSFGLSFRRRVAIFEASELTRSDNFRNPQSISLGLVCRHAVLLLVLLAILGKHINPADSIRRFHYSSYIQDFDLSRGQRPRSGLGPH